MECTRLISEQPANVENRRCFPRHRVKTLAYIDLGSNNGGTLINVSEGGLSFQGIQPLELGQTLPVRFKLPGIDESFHATGQIAWLLHSKKGGGLTFIELPEGARDLINEWGAASSDDLGEKHSGLRSRIEPEKDHSQLVLRAIVQRNRASSEMNKTLADLLRDPSLSRDAVIEAVNASRSGTTADHSADSTRTPRFPYRTRVEENLRTKSPTTALRIAFALTLALVSLLGVALYQHHRGNVLSASSPASGDSPVGLKVVRIGEDWQVNWNRNSDVLAKAVSGSLTITDGPSQKQLELNSSELRSGSIIYTPATDDVMLRLQVVTENTADPVSESVRIVAGKVP
jgi:hypothetical protein